jgi:hypothetical protein
MEKATRGSSRSLNLLKFDNHFSFFKLAPWVSLHL